LSIHFEKVLTDPLGLAGYALFLIFGVVTLVVKQNKPKVRWTVPAGFALGALCVIGCLSLAYRRQTVLSQPPPPNIAPSPSLKIDKVDQKVNCGDAVAGIQGNVIASGTCSSNLKPKP